MCQNLMQKTRENVTLYTASLAVAYILALLQQSLEVEKLWMVAAAWIDFLHPSCEFSPFRKAAKLYFFPHDKNYFIFRFARNK